LETFLAEQPEWRRLIWTPEEMELLVVQAYTAWQYARGQESLVRGLMMLLTRKLRITPEEYRDQIVALNELRPAERAVWIDVKLREVWER
jgi:hypothetical protein